MASSTSFNGPNSGFQVMQNDGHITAQFLQSNTSLSQASLNQACLRDLRATNPHDDKERIKSTNGGLFRDSYRWILDNKEFRQWQDSHGDRLLWIRGDPGKGKTMLLCGIIEELTRMNQYNTSTISFFFCQATDIRINNATAVLRGLIYSIVIKRPSLLVHVRSRYDQAGKALFEDVNAWIALSAIFKEILEDQALESAYMVIDALDECTDGLSFFLDLIVQVSSIHQKVKWIVSSRNWPEIIERLDSTKMSPISLELNEAYVSEAVNTFIQYKVDDLAKNKNYSDALRDAVNDHLLSNSQGTFLWVALVCRELSKTLRGNTLQKLETFPPGLDALYNRMINRVLDSENADICIEILALVSIVYRPITIDELCMMVKMPSIIAHDLKAISGIIAMCGSFLTLRQNTVEFIHQSAKEFLLQQAHTRIFPGGIKAKHHLIFTRTLSSLFQTLQRDIYDIKAPGLPATQVEKPSPDPLRSIRYACVYWVEHLQAGGYDRTMDPSLSDGGNIDGFLQQKFLQWLEALSILGSISYGIQVMQKLESFTQEKSESRALINRARDASRFIRYHKTAIESSPLQVYYSPLIFSPRESLTSTCYQPEKPNWVLNDPIVVENWSRCLQTFEGHSAPLSSISWSPCGNRLASASHDFTVRIWDPATGHTILTLEPHEFMRFTDSISWYPDGSQFASASGNNIKIWDPATGHITSTFKHTGVCRIVWSPDGSRLASASDESIKIWNTATGQTVLVLEVHDRHDNIDIRMLSITWSLDGSRLASASEKSIRIWDPATGQIILDFEHNRKIPVIAWSPDGSQLALTSFNNNILTIWNPAMGQNMSTLEGHSRSIGSIAWSRNGSLVASASSDNAIRIWDPATGQVRLILGPTRSMFGITWSPDGSQLASASGMTITIWDLTAIPSMPTCEKYDNPVTLIAWSQNGSRVASASAGRVRIWDPATGQIISILERITISVWLMAWSLDGSRLASAYSSTIMVWDLATGRMISRLEHLRISMIAWSPDGSRIVFASYDKVVIWNLITGQIVTFLEGHRDPIDAIAWSQDGSRLVSASFGSVKIWDAAIGQIVSILNCERNKHVTSLAWSHDGSRLASAFSDAVRIWDLATGQCVSTLDIISPFFLKFDDVDFNKLHTNTGIFDIGSFDPFVNSSHSPILPNQRGYGLSRTKSWITYNGVKILWLPLEYRFAYLYPSSTLPAKLVIGCASGRCIFLILAEPRLEHGCN
ncbi:hypothetical protein N7504_000500 [Penicillium tannophilum]|nr:hypothetical protein N7504_000500 [Penicillium tannophilum]